MPRYRNTKTGIIYEWTEEHYKRVKDKKSWECLDKPPPKKAVRKKAVRKKAK